MLNGHEQDPQVQPERPALDVVEIVLDPLAERSTTAPAVDLRPAGHPAGHGVPQVVVGDCLAGTDSTKRGRSGRGPTRLISPRSTFQSWGNSSMLVCRSQSPIRVHALVMIGGPDRSRLALGVALHASELDDAEQPPPLSDALLSVENRPAGRDQDCHRLPAQTRERASEQGNGSRAIQDRFAHRPQVSGPNGMAAIESIGRGSTGCSDQVGDGRRAGSEPRSSRPESTKTQCTMTSELISWVTGMRSSVGARICRKQRRPRAWPGRGRPAHRGGRSSPSTGTGSVWEWRARCRLRGRKLEDRNDPHRRSRRSAGRSMGFAQAADQAPNVAAGPDQHNPAPGRRGDRGQRDDRSPCPEGSS